MKLIDVATAAGTALTNSTTHTLLRSLVLPANFFVPGKVVHWVGQNRVTASQSTDTCRFRCFFGPTTLAGTTIADGVAIDAVDDHVFGWDVYLTCRTTTTLYVAGNFAIEGVAGTVTRRELFNSITGLDFTVAQRLETSGLWSVASASNSCQSEAWIVEEGG